MNEKLKFLRDNKMLDHIVAFAYFCDRQARKYVAKAAAKNDYTTYANDAADFANTHATHAATHAAYAAYATANTADYTTHTAGHTAIAADFAADAAADAAVHAAAAADFAANDDYIDLDGIARKEQDEFLQHIIYTI